MAAESPLWDEILDTLAPGTEEDSTSARGPFGVLKTLEIRWTAQGSGESGAVYDIDAAKYQPKGLASAIFDPNSQLVALLSRHAEAYEGYGSVTTVYLARLAAGELTSIEGRVHELEDRTVDGRHEHKLWTPPTMASEDALAGFQTALADAHFA